AKIDDFPGKISQISAISSMNKRDLREKFKDIDRANIATRNFPMKPEELRRRLKLREGGDNFVFATTLADGKHVLILCKHAV
ncbi:MAG: SAM-dependent methyltransferase, partial [Prevotella sp.]|nr:SAM-dependent methyltransferase [Prevotella sp.]